MLNLAVLCEIVKMSKKISIMLNSAHNYITMHIYHSNLCHIQTHSCNIHTVECIPHLHLAVFKSRVPLSSTFHHRANPATPTTATITIARIIRAEMTIPTTVPTGVSLHLQKTMVFINKSRPLPTAK